VKKPLDGIVPTRWDDFRKSTYSGAASCVEIAFSSDGDVLLRDSKIPDGSHLYFTRREWVAFLAGVRAGQFEPPEAV
jgi:hypothetical protein